MSIHSEQPFHEAEQRYFLAEILKASNLEPVDILRFIQDSDVSPKWENMALPNGRSMMACKHQYEYLGKLLSASAARTGQRSPLAKGKKKRSASSNVPAGSGSAALQQQAVQPQFQFTPVSDSGTAPAFQAQSFSASNTPERAGGKKRGRPSKAERELREAEAAARGEVYQPMKRKPKGARNSTTTDIDVGDDSSAAPSAKKGKLQHQQHADNSTRSPVTPSHATSMPQRHLGQPAPTSAFNGHSLLGLADSRMRGGMSDTPSSSFSGADGLVGTGVREPGLGRPDLSMLHHNPATSFGNPQSSMGMRADLTPRGQGGFSLPGRPNSSGDRGMPGSDTADDQRLRDYTTSHGQTSQPFSAQGYHPK